MIDQRTHLFHWDTTPMLLVRRVLRKHANHDHRHLRSSEKGHYSAFDRPKHLRRGDVTVTKIVIDLLPAEIMDECALKSRYVRSKVEHNNSGS